MIAKLTAPGETRAERLAGALFLLVFVGLIIGTAIHYYHPTPPADYVDGLYRTPGRPDLVIRQGTVEIGTETAKLKLGYLKNVLVGSLDRPLGPFFQSEKGKKAPVEVFFDEKGLLYGRDHTGEAVEYERTRDGSSH